MMNQKEYSAIETVECQMMIRKSVTEVFSAFIDPDVTTNFWFTKSSGKLESGNTLTWEWEMYGVTTEVTVITIEPDELIRIEWGAPITTVDFRFEKMNDNETYVTILNYGFQGNSDEIIAQIKDSTGGLTTVLDGMKAYLEHGININLIADKYPNK